MYRTVSNQRGGKPVDAAAYNSGTSAALEALGNCKLLEKTVTIRNIVEPYSFVLTLLSLRAFAGFSNLPDESVKLAITVMAQHQTELQKEESLIHFLPKFAKATWRKRMKKHIRQLHRNDDKLDFFSKKILIFAYFHDNTPMITVIQDPMRLLLKRFRLRQTFAFKGESHIFHFYNEKDEELQKFVEKQIMFFLKLSAKITKPWFYVKVKQNVVVQHCPKYMQEEDAPYDLLWVLKEIFSTTGDKGPNMESILRNYSPPYHNIRNYRKELATGISSYLNRECSTTGRWLIYLGHAILSKRWEEGFGNPEYVSPSTGSENTNN